MEDTYTTPLARCARILEIFIPGYMFGKAWGIADEKTVDLFRAQFPAAAVDMAEFFKTIMKTDNQNLQRVFSTCSGAIVGFLAIAVLAIFMHFVLRDRKYIDSLRFTAVTLIPVAVLNGTLSHAVKTLLEQLGGGATIESLTQSALQGPRGNIALAYLFYGTALWMMGKRTGVLRGRRWGVVCVGIGFMLAYIAAGLSITPGEWQILLPKLQAALAAH